MGDQANWDFRARIAKLISIVERASKETKINPKTVSKLSLKWEFYAGKDISAIPAIFNGTLYFPSWNGDNYAVKASDGSLVWKKMVRNLFREQTPTIVVDDDDDDHDLLIIGVYGPAFVVAVKRSTGELVWSTQLDQNPATVITMSGTYYKGSFYVGTSSLEEELSIEECCRFRGIFYKLDVESGAAIWGSSPSIDIHRNHVYIATGNLYSIPPHIKECQERENNQTVPTHSEECVEPDNHSNSILASDLDSGKIKWYHQFGDMIDGFSHVIIFPLLAPMMFSIQVKGIKKDIVAAVQKRGFAWALDRNNGGLLWSTVSFSIPDN
ncbi:hypothetical protein Dsin_007448 [Dipteronia sinensis]|uniref:Pyrrolo-quinoline quinone repeat domain-containing protein n=1 Tax=Dipteronia sinensis TaxID=43782 RepID=A0AAE0EGK3_9ROSI|nr:hypothetical protein Dsin_007448 [Dipteronia sinensis]